MRRLLYITMALYPPLLLVALASLKFDFRPDSFGPPLAKAFFFLWLLDGCAVLVGSIVVINRLALGAYPAKTTAMLAPLAIIGVIIGLPPAYVAVELVYKLILYLGYAISGAGPL